VTEMKTSGFLHDEFFVWKHDLKEELRSGSLTVRTERGRMEWALSGETGPFVIGCHGGPGGYDQVFILNPSLNARGFKVFAWSRPGYLRTPLKVARKFEEQADALVLLMDKLKIERAALTGFSAGGPVALHFALRHPDRIWALILECAVTRRYIIDPENMEEKLLYSRLMFNDPMVWIYHLLAEHAPRSMFKSVLEMESTLSEAQIQDLLTEIMHDADKVQTLMGLIKSMSPSSMRRTGLVNDLKQLARLKRIPLEQIAVPTLVVHGRHDSDVSFEHAEYAADRIPGAELFAVENGFHIMPVCECADEVTERKVEFLQKHMPRN